MGGESSRQTRDRRVAETKSEAKAETFLYGTTWLKKDNFHHQGMFKFLQPRIRQTISAKMIDYSHTSSSDITRNVSASSPGFKQSSPTRAFENSRSLIISHLDGCSLLPPISASCPPHHHRARARAHAHGCGRPSAPLGHPPANPMSVDFLLKQQDLERMGGPLPGANYRSSVLSHRRVGTRGTGGAGPGRVSLRASEPGWYGSSFMFGPGVAESRPAAGRLRPGPRIATAAGYGTPRGRAAGRAGPGRS
eukprot:766641-Hanusia_phi.AAC.3